MEYYILDVNHIRIKLLWTWELKALHYTSRYFGAWILHFMLVHISANEQLVLLLRTLAQFTKFHIKEQQKALLFLLSIAHKRSETLEKLSNFHLILIINSINWFEKRAILRGIHKLQMRVHLAYGESGRFHHMTVQSV
jgi:hypothetical protein